MNKKKIIQSTLLVLVLLTLVVTTTYAWFSTNVKGNENSKNIISSTATLKIDFTDGKQIVLENAKPGSSTTKTFTVKNTGTDTVYYKINWQEFNNTITNDELTIKLTCTSSSGTCSGVTEEAAYDRDIKDNIELPTGVTHTYTLTVSFIDTNQNQKENQGKSFSGVLQIEGTSARWDKDCKNNNSLRCKIITDNTTQSDNNINFSKISSPTNGQGVYVDDQLGDSENYYFRGGSFCAYTNYASEDNSGTKCTSAGGTWSNYKCSLDLSKSACESKGFTWYELNNNVKFGNYYWRIIRIDENGDVRLLYNGTSTTSLGSASTIGGTNYNANTGDAAYVGYMQPDLPKVYINNISSEEKTMPISNIQNLSLSKTYSFDKTNGMYTLDGEVISGTAATSFIGYYTCINSSAKTCSYLVKLVSEPYNLDVNGIMQIKVKIISNFFTNSKSQSVSNKIDSPIKTMLEDWYKTNLISYDEKISYDISFCNDRASENKDGGFGNNNTIFKGNVRTNKKLPSFKCENMSNDLFTTNSEKYGNKLLKNPIGLITIDEAIYSGVSNNTPNYSNFLHNGTTYWTITPISYTSGNASSYEIVYNCSISSSNVVGRHELRSVTALNSKAIVTSGDGSLANPYIVE